MSASLAASRACYACGDVAHEGSIVRGLTSLAGRRRRRERREYLAQLRGEPLQDAIRDASSKHAPCNVDELVRGGVCASDRRDSPSLTTHDRSKSKAARTRENATKNAARMFHCCDRRCREGHLGSSWHRSPPPTGIKIFDYLAHLPSGSNTSKLVTVSPGTACSVSSPPEPDQSATITRTTASSAFASRNLCPRRVVQQEKHGT